MMKNMKKTIAVLLIIMLGISILAGCGGESLSGKYVVLEIIEDGETIRWADYVKEIKDMYDSMGMEFDESELDFYLEFLKDGKCQMVSGGEVGDGTFKVDGKSVEITFDDDTAKGTIDGKRITLDSDGSKMVLEKK